MENENLVCKLKKSIYVLKQASSQWYLKFGELVTNNGLKENIVNWCIYMKVSGRTFIFMVSYVDVLLLATNDIAMFSKTKPMLCSHFDMEDLGGASLVLGLKIL